MGAMCANTACGKKLVEWKALREMNKKGIFTPEQVNDEVEKNWNSEVGDGTFANKEQASTIAENTVNVLGNLGSGKKFS